MRGYLKELRKEKNLTQQNVAEQLGIAQNSYCMIENGERKKKMDMDTAQKLAKIFDVSLEYICAQESKVG